MDRSDTYQGRRQERDGEEGMTDMTPEDIVEVLVPVIERTMVRRLEDVYGTIEQLRGEFQQTINIMDGNDRAIIAEIQRLRGSGGEQVAEVLTRAAESWDRFVRAEAENLGLKVLTPKGVEKIEVRDEEGEADE